VKAQQMMYRIFFDNPFSDPPTPVASQPIYLFKSEKKMD
jgi:hypothetical protein